MSRAYRRGAPWSTWSLRARLTAAAVAVIGCVLSSAALFLAATVHSNIQRNVDNTARERARAVAAAVTTAGADAIADVASKTDAVVQVVDDHGTVVLSSSNARGLPRLFFFTPASSVSVHQVPNRLPIPDGADHYRVAVVGSRGARTVYAAIASDDVPETTRLVAVAAGLGVPVLTILLTMTTWALVGRALRPVEALRQQAERISHEQPGQRLTPSAAEDELRRLADTLNEMLSRLDMAGQRQRDFAAAAAHELRSPLSILRAHLEVAATSPTGLEALPVRVLLAEIGRMSGLVDNLLHLARIDGRRLGPTRPVDLDDIVFSEVARIRSTCEKSFDLSRVSAAQVDGDVGALTYLVRNLLDNASRHAQSHISTSLEAADHVELTVADDGPGVLPADRERIFERFTRLDDARAREDGGFGLGLAIVRDVAAWHGGSVAVTGDGPGARFVVRLSRSSGPGASSGAFGPEPS